MNRKRTIILLILIILLASALRFSSLAKEDYWLDEGFTMFTGEQPTFAKVTDSVLFYETAPPFYFYILNIWIKLFGSSSTSTRSLSALLGILSIPIIFLTARNISDDKTALLTSLLSAVSMLLIWTSQEVRPYSLLVFLAVLSSYFLTLVYKNNNLITCLLYFVSLILLFYTSYFSVFIVFFQFMVVAFTKRYKLLAKVFLAQFIAFLFLVPWLINAIPRSNLSSSIVYELLFYHAGLPSFIAKFGQLALVSPLIFLSLFLIIIFLISTRRIIKLNKLYPFISLLIIFLLLGYILLLLNIHQPIVRKLFTYSRYFIFLLPASHFIVSKTYFSINKKLKITMLIVLILTSLVAIPTYYAVTLKEEWTPAMKFIQQTRDSSGGIIFVDEGGANMYLINHYYEGEMPAVELAWKDKELTATQILELTDDKDFAWLILSRNWKRGDYYLNVFNQNFNLIKQKEFYGIKLYLYEVP